MEILDLINEGKVKRFFQSRNKLSFEGATYHITQRAPGKESLFVEDSDYLYMIHLFKEGVKKFNYELFAFVLMPNHLHLLLRLKRTNLSQAMKNLFELYAKYFNKKYERKGPVFCKPFRGALCLDNTYLLASSIYIHLNPLKSKLIKNLLKYRWSSYSLYKRDRETQTFVNYKFILKILDEDIKKAKEFYTTLIINAKLIKTDNVLENPKALNKFHANIYKFFKQIFSKEKIKEISGIDTLNNEELERKIIELKNKKRLRKPQEVQARKFLVEQLLSRNYNIKEIADRLNTSRITVYKIIKLT